MSMIEKMTRMRSLYDDGVILDRELSTVMLLGILDGDVSTFEECKPCLSPGLRDLILEQIQAYEANDYMDPNPFVNVDLSDDEKKERALRLKPAYKAIFSDIKSYFAAQEM